MAEASCIPRVFPLTEMRANERIHLCVNNLDLHAPAPVLDCAGELRRLRDLLRHWTMQYPTRNEGVLASWNILVNGKASRAVALVDRSDLRK